MGNLASFKVKGQEKVTLKMTFGKEIVLNNVLRVNLVSGLYLAKITVN